MMDGFVLLLVHVLGFTTIIKGSQSEKYSHILQHHKRYVDNLQTDNASKMQIMQQLPEVKEYYLTQPLDHFEVLTTRTYRQRYLVVDQYWRQSEGPVFLYIAGEWELNPLEITNGHITNMAKKYGALIVGVEHRFYGKSLNDDSMELDQLNYLSSHQALADLVSFYNFAVSNFSLTEKNLWISFGCSYAGALSAWFRLKYPHFVHGAVASSAPVRAQVNFKGYNEVVAKALGDPVALGSKQCADRVKTAFDTVSTMIDMKQFADIQRAFNVCETLTFGNDLKFFASSLTSNFAGAVQYNTVKQTVSDIGDICKVMTDESFTSAYDALVSMFKSDECMSVSYDGFIQFFRNTSLSSGTTDWRPWGYQTCTQYGYYQSCDIDTECIFLHQNDADLWVQTCTDLYGVEAAKVFLYADFTNRFYGADKPWGSRIVFVNGDLDPWHVLSVQEDLSDSLTSVLIRGASHCMDVRQTSKNDSLAVTNGRIAIENEVEKWLQGPRFYDCSPSGGVSFRRPLIWPLLILGVVLRRFVDKAH